MQQYRSFAAATADPALLAFIKCHVTSFAKWEVLRLLCGQPTIWFTAAEVARATQRPPAQVGEALEALTAEGVLVSSGEGCWRCYRMADEPSRLVVERLVESATHSQQMRQIILANIVGRAPAERAS